MLIVYHSQSGASAQLAAAARDGAIDALLDESSGVHCLRCVDAGSVEVAAADGLLLICAENSGRLAGGAKDFLDRIFYPLHGLGCTKPYALLVSAGNDGRGAVQEAQRIFRGIPFTEATEPRIIRGAPDAAARAQARELGAAFAVGLSMGIF